MFRPLLAFLSFACVLSVSRASYGDCDGVVKCGKIEANGLSFDCRLAGSESGTGVFLLHGFPEWSHMYNPLMERLASDGYRAVACNLRGYSPGASPEGVENYNYSFFESDVFALADASNFSSKKFHLIGHDHGSLLAWRCAASSLGSERLLSVTALSVPHPDAFAAGLYGPTADEAQQIASQYFSMFIMDNSASLNHNLLYYTMGKTSGDSSSGTFSSAEAFQKSLWWYNGAMADGIMALPPSFTSSELVSKGSLSMAALRALYPVQPQWKDGIPPRVQTGNVSLNTLFVCGKKDFALLCTKPYSLKSEDYVSPGFSYQYLEVDCGHDVLHKGLAEGCSSDEEAKKVFDGIVAHLKSSDV